MEPYPDGTHQGVLDLAQDVLDLAQVATPHAKRLHELTPSIERRLGALERPPVAVDLGANAGLFGVWLRSHFPDARITSFECDPLNVDALTRFIAANVRRGSWQVVRARAGVADRACASSPRRVLDVFPYLEGANLLNMDIEGREWAILEDPRLARSEVTEICVEYHTQLCPQPENPRRAAEWLLGRAGYLHDPLFDRSDGEGMLWAWREPITRQGRAPARIGHREKGPSAER